MTDIAMSNLIEHKISEHDKELVELKFVLKQMIESQKDLTDSVKSMATAVNKIDIWLEKMAQLDAGTKESFRRVYEVLENKYGKMDCKADKEDVELLQSQMKDLEVARFFSRYPKLLLALILGLCALNIEPIRKIILGV